MILSAVALLAVLAWNSHVLAESIAYIDYNTQNDSHECSLWTTSSDISKTLAREAVKCEKNEDGTYDLHLLPCYCITQNNLNSSQTVVGFCPYTCKALTPLLNYIALPNISNASQLTQFVCKNFSRTGQMCGECKKGYAPAVYSYSLNCVNCTSYKLNWLKYAAVALGPLTLFFAVSVLCRLSVTSGSVIGYVTVSQVLATAVELRSKTVELSYVTKLLPLKLLATVYSIWNLDFFRIFYEPFCLNPNASMLAIISLDYMVALYPMFLIAITCVLLSLYDKYKAALCCSKLFYWLILRYYQMFNIRNSLIDAFATMLILAYVKILNTSFQLLLCSWLIDQEGKPLVTSVYYSGNLKCFGSYHFPFGLLAVFMIGVFNVFPIIVTTLYPFKCFRKRMCLCKGLVSFHNIMDNFYRSFKIVPKDYRHFAVLYLYVRVINMGLFFFVVSPVYRSFVSVLYVTMAIVIGTVQPHKSHIHNVINAGLFHVIGILKILELTFVYIVPTYWGQFPVATFGNIEATLFFIPPLYGLVLLILKVIPQKIKVCFLEKMKENFTRIAKRSTSFYEESFAHRVSNAKEYSPLVSVN